MGCLRACVFLCEYDIIPNIFINQLSNINTLLKGINHGITILLHKVMLTKLFFLGQEFS